MAMPQGMIMARAQPGKPPFWLLVVFKGVVSKRGGRTVVWWLVVGAAVVVRRTRIKGICND